MLRHLRNTKRLYTIAITLAREDALFIFDGLELSPTIKFIGKLFAKKSSKSKGERLSLVLQKLGPAFIKFGQVFSTRSDLIGEDVANDLSHLRDNLPPFPTQQAREIIEEELGASIDKIFSKFDDTPVAAASIAQVHRATTTSGKDVAVKILRPNIEKAFERDLDFFSWLADIIEKRVKIAKRLKPRQIVETFRESVFLELDLRFEAAAATELADNIKKHEPGFRIPSIEWNLTSPRVMVMEWVDGIKLNDVEAIKNSGFDPDKILAIAARSLFSQVFVDGFFHADLHPGNLFVDKKGNLVAVDFGIMGRLDWNSRLYMAEIIRGFLTQDYRHVAEVHFKAGYIPAGKSIDAFTQACRATAEPIMNKSVNEISVAKLLGRMFKVAAEFEMETQPQLLLLQKTMMVTEGVGRMLNPKLNIWEMARPLVEKWASDNFGLKAKAKDTAKEGKDLLLKLPQMISNAEQALKLLSSESGLKLHPETLKTIQRGRSENQRKWLYLGWGAIAISSLLSLLLLG